MYGDVRFVVAQALPGGAEAGQIYLGLLFLVLISLATRRGIGHLLVIGLVVLVALGLEVADVVVLRQSARSAPMDLLHFLLAPLVLFGLARARLLRP
ncbi:hypothetical protein L2U69_07675 [Zavarzinia compransoris]|uniref:hypothetical protein n=1 Tax=Zavarzinia marina TaxID=2911065 RepID=UPI001F293031|nr:hypothetical protein [Zavarzinia marina]MCF4165517.1 hypothetical protein [Zavarzinia marina]